MAVESGWWIRKTESFPKLYTVHSKRNCHIGLQTAHQVNVVRVGVEHGYMVVLPMVP